MSTPPSNLQLPELTLDAVVTGRRVEVGRPGRRLLLVLHGRQTAAEVGPILRAVRLAQPDPALLLVASVVDLSTIPRLLRSLAQPALKKAYEEAAARLPPELPPAEHVVILPDRDGVLVRALRLAPVDEAAAVALITATGQVVGVHQGGRLIEAALELLTR